MSLNVPLVDKFFFRDGRTSLFKAAAPYSTVTRAVERQAMIRIRQRINRLLPDVAKDIAQAAGKRTGEARLRIIYNGRNRVTGSSFSDLRLRVYGPDYIKFLDEGGTIVPTRGDYLAIPILEGKRPDGSAKLPSPRSWRNIKKTFVYTSKKGKKPGRKFIAYNEQGKLKLIYVLVESVEVTGRDFIDRAYGLSKPAIERIITTEIQQAFYDYVDGPRQRLLPKARITTGRRRRR